MKNKKDREKIERKKIIFTKITRLANQLFFGFVAVLLSFMILQPSSQAAFTKQINYQGKLANSSNVTVPDGDYSMSFRLCTTTDCSDSGDPIWSETHCYSTDQGATCSGSGTDQRIAVSRGYFNVQLGGINNFNAVDFNQLLYMEVRIGGSGDTPTWETLLPRKKLVAVPAAMEAGNADKLDTLDSATSGTNAHILATDSSGNLTASANLNIGSDVTLSRGNSDRLDLASGDSFNIASGSLMFEGSDVMKLSNDDALRLTSPTQQIELRDGENAHILSIFNVDEELIRFNTMGDSYINTWLGVGTTVPSLQLEVLTNSDYTNLDQAVNESGVSGMLLRNPDGQVNNWSALGFAGTDSPYSWDAGIGAQYTDRTMGATSADLAFFTRTGGTWGERMRIKSGGNVGIGTNNPSQQLEITQNFALSNTTNANPYGIIYKGVDSFIHDFNYGDNGTVVTLGFNTFIGANSGNFTMGSAATDMFDASFNTAVGTYTLNSNTLGHENTVMGAAALFANTTGGQNSVLGFSALGSNTTGHVNSAFGYNALYSNTEGTSNTAIGSSALYNNTTGRYNIAIGSSALGENITGESNIAIGQQAGNYIWDLSANDSATNSIYIGNSSNSGSLVGGSDMEVVIGPWAMGLGSHSVVLGNQWNEITYLTGNVGIGTTNPGVHLEVAGQVLSNVPGGGTLSLQGTNTDSMPSIYMGRGTPFTTYLWTIGMSNDEDPLLKINSGYGGGDLMTFTPEGNVGIGTTDPTQKLTVYGSTGGQIRVIDGTVTSDYGVSGNAGYIGTFSNHDFMMYTNNTEYMRIKAGGSVGIGTSNPGYKLDVQGGYVNSSSGYCIAGDCVTSFGSYWTLSGNNLYPNNTSYNLAVGASNAGSAKLYVDGNVGIGTTAPDGLLHLYKSSALAYAQIQSGGNYGAALYLVNNQGTALISRASSVDNNVLGFRNAASGAFHMAIQTDGNVGVGTVTPAGLFDVNAKLTVLSGGNVGIGTTNPISTLEIFRNVGSPGNIVSISNPYSGNVGFSELRLGENYTTNKMGYIDYINSGYSLSGLVKPNSMLIGSGSGATNGLVLTAGGASAPMIFGTGGTAQANERMRITGDGNVGIGTTAPTATLYVTSGDNGVYQNGTFINASTETGYSTLTVQTRYGLTDTLRGNILNLMNTQGSQMIVNSWGSVGLGTTNPDPLNYGNGYRFLTILGTQTGSVDSSGILQLASQDNGANGRSVGMINYVYNANSTNKNVARIMGLSEGTTAGNYGGALLFSTKADGGSFAERMRITGGGNVGIGTTAPVGPFEVNGKLSVLTSGNVGIGTTAPTATLYVTSGDNGVYQNGTFINASTETGYSTLTVQTRYGLTDTLRGNILNLMNTQGSQMIVNSWGSVGLGTTNPDPLNYGNGYRFLTILGTQTGSVDSSGILQLASQDNGANGRSVGMINYVYNANSTNKNVARIMGLSEGTTAGNYGGALLFSTKADGGSFAERMRITGGGNVGIGTTNPSYLLTVVKDQNAATMIDVQNHTTGTAAQSLFYAENDVTNGAMGFGVNSSGYTSSGMAVANKGFISATTVLDGLNIFTAGAGDPLAFGTANLERMRIDGNGNVGIGTTAPVGLLDVGAGKLIVLSNGNVGIGTMNPSYPLDVIKDQNAGTIIGVQNHTTGTAAQSLLYAENDVVNGGMGFGINSSGYSSSGMVEANKGFISATTALAGLNIFTAGAGDPLAFGTAGSERMRIDGNGNVGIGINNPSTNLHVQVSQNSQTGFYVINPNAGAASQASFLLGSGTSGAKYGYFSHFGPYWTADGLWVANRTLISGADTGGMAIMTTEASAPLIFATGGHAAANERMRILSGGNVGIGTANPTTNLYVKSTSHAYLTIDSSAANTEASLIYAKGGTSNWSVGANTAATSDYYIYDYQGTAGTRMVVKGSTGNVGIGTTVPAAALEVFGTGSGGTEMYVGNTNANGLADIALYSDGGIGSRNAVFQIMGSTKTLNGYTGYARFRTGGAVPFVIGTGGAYNVEFMTNDTTRVTINSSGNVGIGTTSPSYKLHVAAPAINNTAEKLLYASVSDSNSYFAVENNGSINGYFGPSFRGHGVYGGGYYVPGLAFIGTIPASDDVADSTPVVSYSTYRDTNVAIQTRPLFRWRNWTTDLMQINASGNIGMGTTSPSYKLDVNGYVNTSTGYCIAGNCVTSWNDISGYWTLNGNNLYPDSTSYNVGIGTTNPSALLNVVGTGVLGTTFQQKIQTASYTLALGINSTAAEIQSQGGVPLYINHGGNNISMVAGNGGNVGIGTSSPGTTIHVKGTGTFESGAGGFAWTGSLIPFHITGANGGMAFADRTLTSAPGVPVAGDRFIWYNSDKNFKLFTDAGGDLLSVKSNGNVGIGTTNPGVKFDLRDSGWTAGGTSNVWQLQDNSGVVRASVNKYGQFVSRGLGANGAFNAYDENNNLRMDMNTESSQMYIKLYNNSNSNTVKIYSGGTSFFNGGNVSIGSTVANAKLDVLNSAGTQIRASYDTDRYMDVTNGGIFANALASQNNYLILQMNGGQSYSSSVSGGILFRTNNVDRALIDKNGNVGIGTTAPISRLNVYTASNYYDTLPTSMAYTISIANSSQALFLGAHNTYGGVIQSADNDGVTKRQLNLNPDGGVVTVGYRGDVTSIGGSTAQKMVLYNGNMAMIRDDDANTVLKVVNLNNGTGLYGNTPGIAGFDAPNGSSGSQAEDILFELRAFGQYENSSNAFVFQEENSNAKISFRAAENFTDSSQATAISFHTTGVGTTIYQERMRLDSEGNLGIGTSIPAAKLTVKVNAFDDTFSLSSQIEKTTGIISGGTGLFMGASDSTDNRVFLQAATETGSMASSTRLLLNPLGGHVVVGEQPGNNLATSKFTVNNGNMTLMRGDDGESAIRIMNFSQSGGDANKPGLSGFDAPGFSSASNANDALLQLRGYGHYYDDVADEYVFRDDNANGRMEIRAAEDFSDDNQGTYLAFWTTAKHDTVMQERMRVTDSGSLGIGTTDPTGNLNIYDSSAANIYLTNGATSSVGDPLGALRFGSKTGSNFNVAYVKAINRGTFSSSSAPTALQFGTTDSGSTSPLIRMTLEENGRLGIGTTAPGYLLHVEKTSAGNVAAFTNTDGTCKINPTSTALDCSSDMRLKKDITTLGSALEKITQLRGVYYHWNREKESDAKHIGFVAQEVEALFPELVGQDAKGFRSVNYTGFAPIMVEAMKQQQSQIAENGSAIQNQELLVTSLNQQLSQTNLTMEEKIVILGKEIDPLKNQVKNLETDVVSLKSENESLTTTLETINSQVAGMTLQLTDQEQRIQKLETEIMNIQTQAVGSNTNTSQISQALEDLDQQLTATLQLSGKVLFTVEGDVAADNLEAKNEIKAANVKADTLELTDQTAGKSLILAGETIVVIETSAVQDSDKIYITPVGSTQGKVVYLSEIKPGISFTVKVDAPAATEDIKFNWLIVK